MWIQVNYLEKGWTNVITSPSEKLLKGHLDRLVGMHGSNNVRLWPPTTVETTRLGCGCQDLNGKSMVFCNRHSAEHQRRVGEIRESVAKQIEKWLTNGKPPPLVKNALEFWVRQIRDVGKLLGGN